MDRHLSVILPNNHIIRLVRIFAPYGAKVRQCIALITSRSCLASLSSGLELPSTKRRHLDLDMLVQAVQHRYQPVNSKTSEIRIPDP